MAVSIHELTSAVNEYLRSISGVNATANDTGAELHRIFQSYFDKALSDVRISSAEATAAASTTTAEVTNAAKEAANPGNNADAYKGLLGVEALRELSDSSYFYTNMIQSSLFKSSEDEDESSNSSSSSNLLNGTSISTLNENSLLSNALLGNNGVLLESDYAKALLEAYKNLPTESVFGDFLL